MTIKDFKQIIEAIPGSIINIPPSILKGTVAAVDISIMIFEFISIVKSEEVEKFTPYDYKINNNFFDKVIQRIIGRLINTFIRNGILPIVVFDGPPKESKKLVVKQRQSKKNILKDEIKLLENVIKELVDDDPLKNDLKIKNTLECLKKKVKVLLSYPEKGFEDLQKAIDEAGFPYIEAENDAEKLCSILTQKGIADFVYTKDFDAVVFGSSAVIRSGNSDGTFSVIIPDLIILGSGLSKQSFIEYCILLGCDYNERIKGFGPKKAFKLISENETIHNFLQNKIISDEDYELINYDDCFNEFFSPETTINLEEIDFTFKRPESFFSNVELLIDFYNKNEQKEFERKSIIEIIETHFNKKIFIESSDGKITSDFVQPGIMKTGMSIKNKKTKDEIPKRAKNNKKENRSIMMDNLKLI